MDSRAVGLFLASVGCGPDGSGGSDAAQAGRACAGFGAVAARSIPARFVRVGEARVGIGEGVGAGGIAAVKSRVTSEPPAQGEIVSGRQGEQDLCDDDQHLQVKGPATAQCVRKPLVRRDAGHG